MDNGHRLVSAGSQYQCHCSFHSPRNNTVDETKRTSSSLRQNPALRRGRISKDGKILVFLLDSALLYGGRRDPCRRGSFSVLVCTFMLCGTCCSGFLRHGFAYSIFILTIAPGQDRDDAKCGVIVYTSSSTLNPYIRYRVS
ncbi:uncharacterized protein BDV17DRAFT_267123 [Aspergillus undulatus]|uniref:uncharacterized protein n=1 Tax=Aspergillus undulatus TaxID=1810928 RepID=UPI003CCD075A